MSKQRLVAKLNNIDLDILYGKLSVHELRQVIADRHQEPLVPAGEPQATSSYKDSLRHSDHIWSLCAPVIDYSRRYYAEHAKQMKPNFA